MFDIIINGLKADDPKTIRRVKGVGVVTVIYIGLNLVITGFVILRGAAVLFGWM
jgi:hypothetical protein